jgi:HlyD family secretion protein
MLKKGILIVIMVSLVAGGYYWYTRPVNRGADAQSYRMTQVRRGPLVQTVATDGRVEPNFVVEVKSKASGEIVRIVYEEGARVKKGELLVELDPSDEQRNVRKMASSLAAARARLAKAQSELATARQTIPATIAEAKAHQASTQVALEDAHNKLLRAQSLDQRQIISQEVLETAETTYQKAVADDQQAQAALEKAQASQSTLEERRHDITLAQAQVIDAEIALEEAQERLADTHIKAPIDGVIIQQLVEQGQIISSGISNVSGGTPLLHVADLSTLFVAASVDETDIGQVRVGQEVQLTADAYRQRTFRGTVVHIAPQGVVESNVTTFNVKIEVEGEGKIMLKPAMSVNVEIVTGRRDDTLMVISTAIQDGRGAKKRVFQLVNGQPVPIPVRTGLSNGTDTEILQGVQEGAEVIANVAVLRTRRSASGQGPPNSQNRARNMSRFMRRLQRR